MREDINQEGKMKEIQEIREMCKQLEKIAEYKVCYETEDKIWIGKDDLDWLADEVEDSDAIELRKRSKFNIDSEGEYYYFLKP